MPKAWRYSARCWLLADHCTHTHTLEYSCGSMRMREIGTIREREWERERQAQRVSRVGEKNVSLTRTVKLRKWFNLWTLLHRLHSVDFPFDVLLQCLIKYAFTICQCVSIWIWMCSAVYNVCVTSVCTIRRLHLCDCHNELVQFISYTSRNFTLSPHSPFGRGWEAWKWANERRLMAISYGTVL